jgi:hypothetical protein
MPRAAIFVFDGLRHCVVSQGLLTNPQSLAW